MLGIGAAAAGALALGGCDWADQLCGSAPVATEGEELCGEAVELNHRPRITDLEWTPLTPRVDQDVRFTATADDSDGDRPTYYWNFGQDRPGVSFGTFIDQPEPEPGGIVTRATQTTSYERPGWYEGKLTVADFPDVLPASYDRRPLRVRVHTAEEFRESSPPVARFTASANPRVGSQVTFNGSTSSDPDGEEIIRYRWDVDGDGLFDQENDLADPLRDGAVDPLATGGYSEAGPHQVTLQVTDEVGKTASVTDTITVATATASPPIAALEIEPNPARTGQTVEFSAAGSSDPDGDIDHYDWDLDGNGSFERTTLSPSTSRLYDVQREIPVTVRVVDSGGLSGTASDTLSVISTEGPPGLDRSSGAQRGRSGGRPVQTFAAVLPTGGGGGGSVRVRLLNLPGRPSSAERAVNRFLRALWYSKQVRVSEDESTGGVSATGLVVAMTRGGMKACLRLRLALAPGAVPTGRLKVLGGTGAAARLRARARFRFQLRPDGSVLAIGNLQARRKGARSLPPACSRRP